MSLQTTLATFENLKSALETVVEGLRKHASDMVHAHTIAVEHGVTHDAFASRSAQLNAELQAAIAFAGWALGIR